MILTLMTKLQILMYDEGGFGNDLLRSIGAGIDSMIYGLISLAMDLLLGISQVRLDSSIVETFSSRIFAILGILMFFKLAMSLLNIIVNPDALNDKQNGVSKIAMRIVVMLIMLIMVNPVFDFAIKRLQPAVIETIPMIVLGTNQKLESTINDDNREDSIAENIAATTFKAFVTKNADNCPDDRLHDVYDETNTIQGIADLIDQRCDENHAVYAFNYTAIFSAGAGLIMALILVVYTVDIAVRTIKLIILQLLAPIPIISYADPKTSKKSFSEWTKMCVSAYVDLFIKLAIIYFVIFLLSELITSKGFVDENGNTIGGMMFVMVVIGIFVFASQAPAYISKIFGITPEKNGSFLGKALGVAAAGFGSFAGSTIGSAVGAGLGAITGGAGGAVTGLFQSGLKGMGLGALSGLAGGASAGLSGGYKKGFQYRNQATDLARKLTGNPKYETGFKGMINRGLKNFGDDNYSTLERNFDNIGAARRDAFLAQHSDEIGQEQLNLAAKSLADSSYQKEMSEYDAQYTELGNKRSSLESEYNQLTNSPDIDLAKSGELKSQIEEIQKQMAEVSSKKSEAAKKYQEELQKRSSEFREQAEENIIKSNKALQKAMDRDRYVAATNNRIKAKETKTFTDQMDKWMKDNGYGKK